MDFTTRDQIHHPSPDRGQSPQSMGSGPYRQCLYNGHVNQNSPLPENRTPTQGIRSPSVLQRWDAPPPAFTAQKDLYTGAASHSHMILGPGMDRLP
jgi:hypothetical protein